MIKVKLRQKPIKNNLISVYLDFLPHIFNPITGEKTRREFLGIHMYADYIDQNGNARSSLLFVKKDKNYDGKKKKIPLSANLKRANQDALEKAEELRTERQRMVFKNDFSFINKGNKTEDFIEYFTRLAGQKESVGTQSGWDGCVKHLKSFRKTPLPFSELNHAFCESFKKYLESSESEISKSSASLYFSKFKACLTQAYKSDPPLLTADLASKIDGITVLDRDKNEKNFLTDEELKSLFATPCREAILKKAALFSALTSLRFSDIEKLTWEEVQYSKAEGYTLKFIQKKTGKSQTTPISENAVQLIGDRGNKDEKVFEGLIYSAHKNKILHEWIKDAGITKKISFHSFRHSYGTLALLMGADLYTVSKNMGHTGTKQTQTYAKVADIMKRKAADLFNGFDLSKV